MKIAIIGNYPPRKCGIATFTENFVKSLQSVSKNSNNEAIAIEVFAMNDFDEGYTYPSIVKMGIRKDEMADYDQAIQYINKQQFDYCHIQHEYGIYGGVSGVYVMQFLARIKIPIAITLHTVLDQPDFYQRKILTAAGLSASKVYVMSKMAIRLLQTVYYIPRATIEVIEHGTPVFKSRNKAEARHQLILKNTKTILTFGLLGRSKGIEVALYALPAVVKKHPDIQYIILGKTHPHVVLHEGESYRNKLKSIAKELKIDNNVLFIDEYVDEERLIKYLSAADIYITPYINEKQITSGTLCYAVASGAAVCSTPYWHASELLSHHRGILFPFNDSDKLEEELSFLLDNEDLLRKYQTNAFEYGQKISWPQIGQQYFDSLKNMISRANKPENTFSRSDIEKVLIDCEPELSLEHLKRLTDDFGLLQHARYIFPNYHEGYCTDDNARGLLFATINYKQTRSPFALELIGKYLSFLNYMRNNNGSYVNFISYAKNKLERVGSEDSFGRSLWALGYLIKNAPDKMLSEYATELFAHSLGIIPKLQSIRGKANTIIGLSYYFETHPHAQEIKDYLLTLSVSLYNEFKTHQTNEWKWYEDILSYDNGILSLSMLYAGDTLNNSQLLSAGLESLNFLHEQTSYNGHMSLIGNERWMPKGEQKTQFSQQAIDAMSMVLAYKKAYKITKEEKYSTLLNTAYTWFLGNNDVYIPLYDIHTKGCCDGLHRYGVNRNQGAESLLSWLIAYSVYHE
jgi:glycosyltransferase involved in cell wall biosynthesis